MAELLEGHEGCSVISWLLVTVVSNYCSCVLEVCHVHST